VSLETVPITMQEANLFVAEHHRHHGPTVSGLWATACSLVEDREEPRICGVAIIGRPVARVLDNGWTVEVTRCCTDGTPHAASKLYGAARKQAVAMGYRQIITYTLEGEPGTSLTAAGFTAEHLVRGKTWHTPSRPRVDKHPTIPKVRWAGL
jgi:hypothetical protein